MNEEQDSKKKLDYKLLHDFLADNVMTPFYESMLNKLTELQLNKVLTRKNPYLFKAKNIEIVSELVKGILDAHLSSAEETIFGDYLESFAIHVSKLMYDGFKSAFASIDLEFKRNEIYYIVSIKSGPYWGNSDQINRMKNNFKDARRELKKRKGIPQNVIAVNGCIYGKDRTPFKQDRRRDKEKDYYKYCGQAFWEFISDDPNLYQEIIKPLDEEAKQKSEIFKQAYAAKVNEMSEEFSQHFTKNHLIDWVKLIDFVSQNDAYSGSRIAS